jgi:hypothetical protein
MDRLMAAQMECDEEEYRALHHKQGWWLCLESRKYLEFL